MPLASLTIFDKIWIQTASLLLMAVSTIGFGHSRIRSIGISNLPLGVCLFCKSQKLFRKNQTNQRRTQTPLKDDDDDDELSAKCFLWSCVQLLTVASGLLDVYPSTIIKATVIFYILVTVQDSVTTRPILLAQEELERKTKEKNALDSALFWKPILWHPFWKLLGFETVVEKSANATNAKIAKSGAPASDKENTELQKNSKRTTTTTTTNTPHYYTETIIKRLGKTKKVVSGKRETAVQDLIWGSMQIAYVVFDLTSKQAIGTAFLVYLCTLLEDVLIVVAVANHNNGNDHTTTTTNKNNNSNGSSDDNDNGPAKTKPRAKTIHWFKISWILLCLYLNGKWFLSP